MLSIEDAIDFAIYNKNGINFRVYVEKADAGLSIQVIRFAYYRHIEHKYIIIDDSCLENLALLALEDDKFKVAFLQRLENLELIDFFKSDWYS